MRAIFKSKKNISRIMLLVFLFTTFFTPSIKTYAAETANLSISLEKLTSGTAPFNLRGGGAGDDLSAEDNIVRTLDVATYQFDYSINPAGVTANNLTLIFNISKDSYGNPIAIWDETAAANLTGQISADKTKITFNLGNVAAGSAKKIVPVLKVLGTAKNGQTFNVSGTMTADNASTVNINTKTLTVSALPKYDLIKKASSSYYKTGPNGEPGTLVTYSIEMVIKDGKGSEAIEGEVSFQDDLSSFGIPYGKLYTWGSIPAVGVNGDGHYVDSIPYGSLNLTSDKEAAVTNSGKITATQYSQGYPIDIKVSNMDSTANHAPIKNANGTSVDTSKKHVFAGYINIWFNNNYIPQGTTTVTNKFTALNLRSVSGMPNFGNGVEPMENNQYTHQVERKEPGVAGISYDSVYNSAPYEKLSTKTDYWTLDGTVLSGQSFLIFNRLYNSEFADVTGASLITKIDNNTLEVIANENSTVGHTLTSSVNEENKYIVEYGTGSYANYKEQHSDTGDTSVNWYTTVNAALASGTGAINKIRVKLKDGQVMRANEYLELAIKVKAKDSPIGTIIPMTTAAKANEVNGGAWELGTFNPSVDNITYTGDKVTVTGAFARISEEVNKLAFKVREVADFTLNPSLSTDGRINNSNVFYSVDIKETLPKGLTYVIGSAKQGNNSFEPIVTNNADGSTLLTWKIQGWEVGVPMEPIKFSGKVNLNVADNSKLECTSVIESSGDVAPAVLRTASVGITITNPGEWGVEKTVLTPLVEPEEDIAYVLKYYQTTENTYHNVVLIDILPFNGDKKLPATSFDGNYSVKEVLANNGEKVYVTADDKATIATDPSLNNSNWFDINDVNGPNKDKITAIKIVAAEFPSSATDREVKITLKPVGNKKDNIYTNNFTGRLSEINKLVESNYVYAKVISSSIAQYVWIDKNSNGIRDISEEGIKNVKLFLYDNLGNKISETTTDSNGNYSFENLKSGTYTVKVDESTIPSYLKEVFEKDTTFDGNVVVNLEKSQQVTDVNFGYLESYGNLVIKYLEEGTNNEIADTKTTTELKGTAYITSSKDITGYKFVRTEGNETGVYVEGTTEVIYYYKKLINIGDFVWNDLNGNGLQEPSEPGIPNVVVNLQDENEKIIGTTTTDATGHYNFNTSVGKYSVAIDLSNFIMDNALSKFYAKTTNTVEGLKDLSVDFKDFDFGYYIPSTIGDTIWVDTNGNNIKDADEEGISNVKINLADKNGAILKTVITDAKGTYKFEEVAPGEYTVSIEESTLPSFIAKTYELDNTLDGNVQVKVSSGDVKLDVDFGYKKQTGTLTIKYVDEAGNEIKAPENFTDTVGTAYTTSKKDIADYNFIKVIGEEIGKYTNENTTVTYVYTKKQGSLVVKHLEEGTNVELIVTETTTKDVKTDYVTTKKDIANYEFVKVVGEEAGVYVEGTTEVTYYYKKKKEDKIIVKYVDESGKEIQPLEVLTKEDSKIKKEIPGYEYVKVEGTDTLTYIYKKIEPTKEPTKEVTNIESKENPTISQKTLPKTGETFPIFNYVCGMALILIGMALKGKSKKTK